LEWFAWHRWSPDHVEWCVRPQRWRLQLEWLTRGWQRQCQRQYRERRQQRCQRERVRLEWIDRHRRRW
jgi:hypothetical protein